MNDSDVLAYHTGTFGLADSIVSNADYFSGAPYGAVDGGGTGRASLGMLSVAILGLMFFYIATRGRQY